MTSRPTWAYGTTVVPSRFNTTLPRTLASFKAGGFDRPRLFIDGAAEIPEHLKGYEITQRVPGVGPWGNWVLALHELHIRSPHADLFMIVQDDVITYMNLRDYLEAIPPRDDCYLNLLCFPENVRKLKGWYPSNQKGRGALALVFSRNFVRALLGHRITVERIAGNVQDPTRGWRFIDGGVVEAAKQMGFTELVHNPSLVQHIGHESSIGAALGDKRRKFPPAPTFLHERFDARELLGDKPPKQEASRAHIPMGRSHRVGLIGYNTANGVGAMNRSLARYGRVDTWLVMPHDENLRSSDDPQNLEVSVYRGGIHLRRFLDTVDTVIFVGAPANTSIPQSCRKMKMRTVCFLTPGQQIGPSDNWAASVDLFFCPTTDACNRPVASDRHIVFPWPSDEGSWKIAGEKLSSILRGEEGWQKIQFTGSELAVI